MKVNHQNQKFAKAMAYAAIEFSKVAANSKCMCIFYQPDKPKELMKLSKFRNE